MSEIGLWKTHKWKGVLWQYGCRNARNYGVCLAMAALPLPMLIFLLLDLHILHSAVVVVGDWAGLLGILLKTFTASCADAAALQRQRHSGSKNKRIVRCLLQKQG